MQAIILTGTNDKGYDACSPCHKGVILWFGSSPQPATRAASWHVGCSRIGDSRCYATATQSSSGELELSTTTERVDFKTSDSTFESTSRETLHPLPAVNAQSCLFAAEGLLLACNRSPIGGQFRSPGVSGTREREGTPGSSSLLPPAAPWKQQPQDLTTQSSSKRCVDRWHKPTADTRRTGGKTWGATHTGHTTVPMGGSEMVTSKAQET